MEIDKADYMQSRMPQEILSHWAKLIDGLHLSSQEFYDLVEAKLQARELEGVEIGRIELHEMHLMSRKRLYLRVIKEFDIIDICAAPYGAGSTFVSYWQGTNYSQGCLMTLVRLTPIIGSVYDHLSRHETYYRYDTAAMFHQAINTSVQGALDEVMKDQGLAPLSAEDRKPVMKDFLKVHRINR